jgi:hypothetical protein
MTLSAIAAATAPDVFTSHEERERGSEGERERGREGEQESERQRERKTESHQC